MRATQGVSVPRSGHGAIYHVASYYFGDAMKYCDKRDFCGCGSVPCANPNRTYAKDHDFGLVKHRGLRLLQARFNRKSLLWNYDWFKSGNNKKVNGIPIIPTERYFIQYRSPIWSITSNFKLYLMSFPGNNTRAHWERFACLEMIYWVRFVDKWILNFPQIVNPPLYCSYEDLIANPSARIGEVIRYLGDGVIDEKRLGEAIVKFPIEERNSISKFKFHDRVFFKELEDYASGRLAKLGLPAFEDKR